MSQKLPDLAEYFDPDLGLPIRGKVYRIPSPGIDEGDRLRKYLLFGPTPVTELDDATDELVAIPFTDADIHRIEVAEGVKILGPVRAQMLADGVPDTMAQHAARTALAHFGAGPKLGRSYWQFAHLADLVDVDALIAEAATAAAQSDTKAPAV
jgi:hypothetical protein